MKFIRQFSIILIISFAGEILNYLIPLPVPASIYGLVIMLICLMTGLVPLDAVKDTGKFLIEIMPLMFIPAAVGLLESWGVLKPVWIPVIAITVISTIAVIAVTGHIAQLVLKRGNMGKENRTGGALMRITKGENVRKEAAYDE